MFNRLKKLIKAAPRRSAHQITAIIEKRISVESFAYEQNVEHQSGLRDQIPRGH